MEMKKSCTTRRFSPEGQTAFEARYEAQKIAFGPVVFQCVRYAWKRGILQALADAGSLGCSVESLEHSGKWSGYSLKVVLESCLSAGVVQQHDDRYVLDKVGYCVLRDNITQANYDFVSDVCYEGLAQLDESLDAQKPLGLKALGPWSTLYEGLSSLPEPAKSSWFAFDHLYSDTSFPLILPDVLATAPRQVMDVGANTGKFSHALLQASPSVRVHLVDLPQQLNVAKDRLQGAGLVDRTQMYPADLLDAAAPLPQGMDLVWMSQFLSCFSEVAIESILSRVTASLNEQGQVLILDTFWDRQKYDIASYCLINTSPYFTAVASGNSKMYESSDYIRLCRKVGLELVSVRDGIGYCHSLMRFKRCDRRSKAVPCV